MCSNISAIILPKVKLSNLTKLNWNQLKSVSHKHLKLLLGANNDQEPTQIHWSWHSISIKNRCTHISVSYGWSGYVGVGGVGNSNSLSAMWRMQLRKCILCRRVGKQTNLKHTYICVCVCRYSCTTVLIYDSTLLSQRLHGATNNKPTTRLLTKSYLLRRGHSLAPAPISSLLQFSTFYTDIAFRLYSFNFHVLNYIPLGASRGTSLNTKLFGIHRIAYAFIAFRCVGVLRVDCCNCECIG